MSHILNKLLVCLKCRIIITPLYRCATQTTLNRLKQPKNFYSEEHTYFIWICFIGASPTLAGLHFTYACVCLFMATYQKF